MTFPIHGKFSIDFLQLFKAGNLTSNDVGTQDVPYTLGFIQF